jgi:NAD(P)-dependent dehydrogenase (short-subunit alcohol dehydrogenase family)
VTAGGADGAGIVAADLSKRDEVARLVEQLRGRYDRISALVHLATLRGGGPETGLDVERWQARLDAELMGLFLIVQGLGPALQEAAAAGGAAVLAATALGGAFAADHPAQAFFPGQGAIPGFLKTLAQETPSVRVKAVDLSPAPARQTAEWLLAELLAEDGIVEIGYREGQRLALETVPAPLGASGATPALDGDAVVLVTGGARGITAEVAVRLAEKYRPTLLLVGRTPLPSAPEPAATAAVTDATALKRVLIEQRRAAGLPLVPARIEEEYQRLLREREIRHNLARLHASGAQVEYYTCDVRDVAAFGALIDAIYRAYGRIDGVIHGAGIIEDKLIRDKTVDSFRRVLETKVHSSLVLATKLRAEGLRFLVFFTSIAGRLGNRGQADYGATNEIVSKLAISLQRTWPGRVVAIDWGPWATLGMATPEIQRQFAERGIALVPVELGCGYLIAELEGGRHDDSAVVVAGGRAVRGVAGAREAVAGVRV